MPYPLNALIVSLINEGVKGLTHERLNDIINAVIPMARPAMNEDDPLTSRQFSIPASMYRALRKASEVSGKSQAQIVREALEVEIEKAEYKRS